MNFESQFPDVPDESAALDDIALQKRRKRILLVAAALAALVLIAFMFLRSGQSPDAQAGADDKGPAVTVVIPGRTSVATTVNATGTLAARREMPVGVAGEGGRVQSVLVEPGAWVKAGQILARVERSVQTEQGRSLGAAISVAQADARLAQSELDRAQALVGRGFISKADIDRKIATRDAAFARVRVAQAQYQEQHARTGQLDVRAPAAGLVLTRSVEPGQIISSGSGVLFRLAKGGEMELLAKVSEADLARLNAGMNAQVTPVGGVQSYPGQIWQIAPVIDPQSRQGIARIALHYNRELRPGGFAAARIVSGQNDVPVLPESALQSDGAGSYVYIVTPANTVERRNVTPGQVSARGVSILSGLTGGENIVVLAGGFLNPGQKVRPVLQGRN
ncbi:MAG: efflux RND transporter periplasmic adaptor subunit [Sphingobium sp.]